MIDHRLIEDRLIGGMSRLLESRRQDRMKEINLKVSLPEKKKEMLSGRVHALLADGSGQTAARVRSGVIDE